MSLLTGLLSARVVDDHEALTACRAAGMPTMADMRPGTTATVASVCAGTDRRDLAPPLRPRLRAGSRGRARAPRPDGPTRRLPCRRLRHRPAPRAGALRPRRAAERRSAAASGRGADARALATAS